MNQTMNTTKQEHPEMEALAEQHKAEMAHLPKAQQEQIKLVVAAAATLILQLPEEAADLALKHITETYQACSK